MFHVTVAFLNPALTTAPVGGLGGVDVAVATADADAVPTPTALTAATVNE
jgi:hypothetical protein